MRDRGLPPNSLYSSTRCLSFHVEWQVELRKDKEGLDTVGILLAQHYAHQSTWHHVEAQLSVLYVFWNKGVTCDFFLLRAHQHASAGFSRQRAFMQKLLPPWLLTLYREVRQGFAGHGGQSAREHGQKQRPVTRLFAECLGCNSMAIAARLPIYEDVLEFFHCSPPLQNGQLGRNTASCL